MIVMKFGGSSVGDTQKIKDVAEIIKHRLEKKPIVVVSAVKGITDMLIETAERASKNDNPEELLKKIKEKHDEILKELKLDETLVDAELAEFEDVVKRIVVVRQLSLETMDTVQSFGERMSSKLVAAYLGSIGIKSKAHNAYDIGMITNPDFGNADPLNDTPDKLKNHLQDLDYTAVITGFIGMTNSGHITTLGRGGSDYTAAIIGAALDAEEIQIWTDVDGIMTSDPRIVENAMSINKVSFAEASELAFFGAKVLHPKTIIPAVEKDIPVRVLNTYNPEHKGTLILSQSEKSDTVAKAIACKKNVTLVNINSSRMIEAHGFLARIFNIFEEYKISIDMISTSEVNVSLTIDNASRLGKAVSELQNFADVKVEKEKALICIVGEGMKNTVGLAGKVFNAVSDAGVSIEMISQGASEINISFLVDQQESEKAVVALHDAFFG